MNLPECEARLAQILSFVSKSIAHIDPNKISVTGSSPLFEALENDCGNLCAALLESGANINSPGPQHKHPVHLICFSGGMERIESQLLAAPEKFDLTLDMFEYGPVALKFLLLDPTMVCESTLLFP